MLLLWSSSNKFDCFIETKSLDGETNLKVKAIQERVREFIPTDSNLNALDNAEFNYEEPNPALYEFSGSITANQDQIPIDNNNIILRGCKLKNTESIIGAVCFTGHYTKIMMNSIKAKPKHSDLEKKLGMLIVIIFGMLIVFCVIAALMYIAWYNDNKTYLSYIELGDLNLFGEFWIRLGNWILIFG